MSKTKHTAGKWEVKMYDQPFVTSEGGQTLIAEVCLNDGGEQAEANAKLIAASPDLLCMVEKLKELLADYMLRTDIEKRTDGDYKVLHEAESLINSAIQ